MCVAYLDGKTPCLIVVRGTYNVIHVLAYEYHDGKLRLVKTLQQNNDKTYTYSDVTDRYTIAQQ